MIVFLSPSKTFTNNYVDGTSLLFPDKSNLIRDSISKLSFNDLKVKLDLSDKLVKEVYQYYHDSNTSSQAMFLYGGIVYKALDPSNINFINNKLYILSGQYGLLRSTDMIFKYRLDFNNRMLGSLYNFWKDDINNYILNNYKNEILVDLTSKEFTSLIPKNNKIRIDFCLSDKNISTVLLKKMRGLFAKEIINNNIATIEELKKLNVDGFKLLNHDLTENTLIFIK